MKTCKLPLAQIVVADSRYRFLRKAVLDRTDPRQKLIANSIKTSGIITPLIVHDTGDGVYHLVDGFCRALWAVEKNAMEVDAFVISAEEAVETVIMIALGEVSDNDPAFGKKARLVAMAQSLGVREDILIKTILPALNLEPHKNVLKNIESAATLPVDILEYCSCKNFSMKQVNALTRRDRKLLEVVFSWREKINLTARNYESITEQIKDIINSRKLNLDEFLEIVEMKKALSVDASTHERTEQLKNAIETLARPTLTAINAEIKDAVISAALPKGTSITWDKTLEKQEVIVSITASDKDEFLVAAKTLSSDKTITAIERIIEKL